MSTATTLLIRCQGPMQSWGTRSRFGLRDTGLEPSKSGVVGLLACALGRPRGCDPSDLAALKMAVRVDRPGNVESDYHTVGGGTVRGESYGVGKASGAKPETQLSTRHYLADADFLVALEGDRDLLETAQAALADPRWPLFLGRKGFVPSLPPWIPDGLLATDCVDALRRHSWPTEDGQAVSQLRAVVECAPGEVGDRRQDVPVSFSSSDRRYAPRLVRDMWLTPKEDG